jgi:large conductance mechanosensitive channel
MPRLEEEDIDLVEQGERQAKRLYQGFMDFAFSGNTLEIAFGLMLVRTIYNSEHRS